MVRKRKDGSLERSKKIKQRKKVIWDSNKNSYVDIEISQSAELRKRVTKKNKQTEGVMASEMRKRYRTNQYDND